MVNKAVILTIERTLDPKPPRDAKPRWYYQNTLGFYKNHELVWEQKIPEARISWMETYRGGDEVYDSFDTYGQCSVFYEENIGWRLRWIITHQRAKKWLDEILSYIEAYHTYHFIRSDKKMEE